MGNRAVITTPEDFKSEKGVGVYLHWNGGRDSVVPFLRYCKMRGFRCPENDIYGWARLVQVIANFQDMEGLSVGIGHITQLDLDNYDNGVYLIQDWEIVGREFLRGSEQNTYDELEFLHFIDECQPEAQKLGDELIDFLYEYNMTVWDLDGWEITHPAKKEEDIVERVFTRDGLAELWNQGGELCRVVSVDGSSVLIEKQDGQLLSAKGRVYLPRQHMEVAVTETPEGVKAITPRK